MLPHQLFYIVHDLVSCHVWVHVSFQFLLEPLKKNQLSLTLKKSTFVTLCSVGMIFLSISI
jgi:hypothetical protein